MRESEGEWDKTVLLNQRLKNNPFFEEPDSESKNGYYRDRLIIGRDTPINQGVYLGGGQREALVVDDENDFKIKDVYNELLKRRQEEIERGGDFKTGVLTTVYNLVQEQIPSSFEAVEKIAKTYNLGPDRKIHLGHYVGYGGVCRHQALLGAYLLERLKRDGNVSGDVSIDRNYVPQRGGHAWIRYTNSIGTIFIIDPAQNYIGRLENIKEDHEKGIGRWFYERP